MLTHAYNIVIDRIFGAPVHDREVVGGLNATDKRFFQCLLQQCNFRVNHLTAHIWQCIPQL